MAISLKDMESADYETFLQIAISDYAESKVKNKAWLVTDSISKTQEAFRSLLPDGVQTKDQYFWNIMYNHIKSGYLWCEMRQVNNDKVVFINYIYILPVFRKHGLGKETLTLAKDKAKIMGAQRIELHVFGFNTEAIKLYEQSGFEQTNIVMRYEL